MKPDEIEGGAARLPDGDRPSSLAARLLQELESPVYEVSDAEVERRMAEAEEDPGVMITLDELAAGLKKRGS